MATTLTKGQILQEALLESYGDESKEFWAWVSPDNQLYKVPRLRHSDFIMPKYAHVSRWDTDRVFDAAFKDGWVRVIYEYDQRRFMGTLSVNTYSEERAKDAIKHVLFNYIKYGHNVVFVDAEQPKAYHAFSTNDSASKYKLLKFLGFHD